MRIPRIYTGQTLSKNILLELEPGPSAHIARALRMQAGDDLTLFNGEGGEYAATLKTVGKKTVFVDIGPHRDSDTESPLAIHLGIAISRGERMDWIVQKATELGVQSLSPLLSERTEVKLKGDRADKKRLHWQQITIAACEQCGRNQLPQTNPLQSLTQWLDTTDANRKYVLHHRAPCETGRTEPPASIALLIGPAEITQSEQAGFQSLKLGPRIMRTETAPLAAIAILQARWGDMQAELL